MIEELYKKKLVRDFLSLFSESKWKDLIFLSVEYGIIMLKRNFNVASLSLDDLTNILDDLKEEENKRMRQNLKKYETEMNSNKNRNGSVNKQVNTKPSSGWRKGDDTVFDPTRERNPGDETSTIELSRDKKTQIILDKILKTKRSEKNTAKTTTKSKGNNSNNISSVSSSKIYPEWWGSGEKKMFSKKSSRKPSQSKNNIKSKYLTDGYHSSNENSNFRSNKEKILTRNSRSRASSNDKSNYNTNSHFDKKKILEVESKIKSRVETDKKIFNLLKNKQSQDQGDERDHSNYEDYNDQQYNNEYDQENNNYENNECSQYQNNQVEYSQYNNNQCEDNSKLYAYQNTDQCQNEVSHSYIQNYNNTSNNNITYNEERSEVRRDDVSVMERSEMGESLSQSVSRLERENYEKYILQNRRNDKNSNPNNKANYVIEYDKDLKPQVIKEKNLNEISANNSYMDNQNYQKNKKSNSRNENKPHHQKNFSNVTRSDMSYYSKNFPQDSPYLIPTEISNIDQNSNQNRFNLNAYESIYNSQQISDRNGETILREQFVSNYINKNPKQKAKQNYTNPEDSNVSVTRSNNNEYYDNYNNNSNYYNSNSNYQHRHSRQDSGSVRNKLLSENQINNFSARDSTTEVISPHFNNNANNYIRYSREINQQRSDIENIKRTLSGQSTPHGGNYAPYTIQNEEFIKPAVSFKRNEEEPEDLDESGRLSSYTPSERTKMFFQKDMKTNMNDSRYSYKNQNYMNINTNQSNINDSMNESRQSLKIDSQYIKPVQFVNLTSKLNEKDLQKYNSSENSIEEDEIYIHELENVNTKNMPKQRSLQVENTTKTTEGNEPMKTYNTVAEELSNKLKDMMAKNFSDIKNMNK